VTGFAAIDCIGREFVVVAHFGIVRCIRAVFGNEDGVKLKVSGVLVPRPLTTNRPAGCQCLRSIPATGGQSHCVCRTIIGFYAPTYAPFDGGGSDSQAAG
jgi:hypothetical protein